MQKLGLILFTLFALISFHSFAQKNIVGQVLINDKPVHGVAVYFDNTQIGTTTDDDGVFQIPINQGDFYTLVVSHLGYETIFYNVSFKSIKKKIVFKLTPKVNVLDEVVLNNTKISKEDRRNYLFQFKRAFIGTTYFSKSCSIENEDDIRFYYDKDDKILEAYANKPIVLKNKKLGYLIHYDLVDFKLSPTRVTFMGYSRFEAMEGSKRKQKNWKENRLKAYKGSAMHFLRVVQKPTEDNDGFYIDQFIRQPNPDRPSDSIIKASYDYIRKNKKHPGHRIFHHDSLPKTKMDSAYYFINKAKLKKHIEIVYMHDVKAHELTQMISGKLHLTFKDYLRITYNNTPKDKSEAIQVHAKEISVATLEAKRSEINRYGALLKPLDFFTEGWWAFEKMGDALPLDYFPNKD